MNIIIEDLAGNLICETTEKEVKNLQGLYKKIEEQSGLTDFCLAYVKIKQTKIKNKIIYSILFNSINIGNNPDLESSEILDYANPTKDMLRNIKDVEFSKDIPLPPKKELDEFSLKHQQELNMINMRKKYLSANFVLAIGMTVATYFLINKAIESSNTKKISQHKINILAKTCQHSLEETDFSQPKEYGPEIGTKTQFDDWKKCMDLVKTKKPIDICGRTDFYSRHTFCAHNDLEQWCYKKGYYNPLILVTDSQYKDCKKRWKESENRFHNEVAEGGWAVFSIFTICLSIIYHTVTIFYLTEDNFSLAKSIKDDAIKTALCCRKNTKKRYKTKRHLLFINEHEKIENTLTANLL